MGRNRQIVVLVGGGHAHLEVIRRFSEQSASGFTQSGINVVLISPEPYSLYSGMVPGVLAGHYQPRQAMIGLASLCARGPVEWIQARVIKIDPLGKCLHLSNGRQFRYDLVSLDVGSETDTAGIVGNTNGTTSKPISTMLERWQYFVSSCQQQSQSASLTVVGGGVAGVELVLAARHRLPNLCCRLISSSEMLRGHNILVRRKVNSIMAHQGISLWEDCTVTAIREQTSDPAFEIRLSDQTTITSDFVLIATQGRTHDWISSSTLPKDTRGFLPVNSKLQINGYCDHFAVGDAAGFDPPLAKAGVYPVRQAPILAHNLLAQARGEPLLSFKPQHRFLNLIATGNRHAVASRGWFYCSGHWVWLWKNKIDQQFVGQYQV